LNGSVNAAPAARPAAKRWSMRIQSIPENGVAHAFADDLFRDAKIIAIDSENHALRRVPIDLDEADQRARLAKDTPPTLVKMVDQHHYAGRLSLHHGGQLHRVEAGFLVGDILRFSVPDARIAASVSLTHALQKTIICGTTCPAQHSPSNLAGTR
jgi:hypothetical protein